MRLPFVLVAGALLVAGSACAASGAGRAAPALRVGATAVHGSHFRAREVVRMTFLTTGDSVQRRVRTSSSGAFTAELPARRPCVATLLVVARGASGDTARLELRQRPCDALP